MVVRRSRTLAADADAVWRVVRDPYHLPRWWPRTDRVEGVSSAGWTSVLTTDRGRSIRADYRVELTKGGERRRWSQELEGTPFERLFTEVTTDLSLAAAGEGTKVEIAITQKPRGFARFGGFMLRRATKRQLDDALKGLADAVEAA